MFLDLAVRDLEIAVAAYVLATGAEFDRAYINHEFSYHQQVIEVQPALFSSCMIAVSPSGSTTSAAA
jgi:hypothetical protein